MRHCEMRDLKKQDRKMQDRKFMSGKCRTGKGESSVFSLFLPVSSFLYSLSVLHFQSCIFWSCIFLLWKFGSSFSSRVGRSCIYLVPRQSFIFRSCIFSRPGPSSWIWESRLPRAGKRIQGRGDGALPSLAIPCNSLNPLLPAKNTEIKTIVGLSKTYDCQKIINFAYV